MYGAVVVRCRAELSKGGKGGGGLRGGNIGANCLAAAAMMLVGGGGGVFDWCISGLTGYCQWNLGVGGGLGDVSSTSAGVGRWLEGWGGHG